MANKKKKNFRKTIHNGEHTQNKRLQASSAQSTDVGNKKESRIIFPNEFSLQDVAKNTKRKDPFWNSDRKLRHSKISFVSAGTLESFKPKDTVTAFANLKLNPSLDEPNTVGVERALEKKESAKGIRRSKVPPQDSTTPTSYPGYFIDLHGTKPVQTGFPPPCVRSSSPTPSDSSEEVILFKGRNFQERNFSARPKTIQNPAALRAEPSSRVIEDTILAQGVRADVSPPLNLKFDAPAKNSSSIVEYPSNNTRNANNSSESKLGSLHNAIIEDEEELLNDYIENIDSEDMNFMFSFTERELDSGFLDKTATSCLNDHEMNQGRSKCESPIIQDFDDLSTTENIKGQIQEILAQRDRNSEVQYLVIWQGLSIREAQWVPTSALSNSNALSMIELFQSKEKLSDQFSDESEDEDSEDENFEDENSEFSDDSSDTNELSSEEEGGYLYKRHHHGNSFNDEDIARMLAKQEELGMASDKILLFDETLSAGVNFTGKTQKRNSQAISKNKAKKHSSQRARWNHPNYSPFVNLPFSNRNVDQLDEFDFTKSEPFPKKLRGRKGDFTPKKSILSNCIIDLTDNFDYINSETSWKKGKGRKGRFFPDKSNLEFEEQMRISWQKDRSKKKKRKQEREKLRIQGLLGNKHAQPDLKKKYHEGMNNFTLRKEIKAFLKSRNSSLALPPMNKNDRKYAHEVANAFNMKSKSKGTGINRFPVLYRTSKTFNFTEEIFDAVEAKIACRFLHRGKFRGRMGALKGGSKPGKSNSGMNYQDGDIVGGSAPELASDNRGRAMLEKMGWCSGTALGALDNKGILQPVIHIVKTTKAGLG